MVKLLALLGLLAVGSEAAITVSTTYDINTDTTTYVYSGVNGENLFIASTCSQDGGTVTTEMNPQGQMFEVVNYGAVNNVVTVSIPRKAISGQIAYFTDSGSYGYIDGPTCDTHPALTCGASTETINGASLACVDGSVLFSVSAATSSGYTSLEWSSAVASDISDNTAVTPTITVPVNLADQYHCGTVSTSLKVVDLYGNEKTCAATSNLSDTTPPELKGHLIENMTVECDDVPATPVLSSSDNCGTEAVVDSQNDISNGVVNTFTTTDWCGNITSKVQSIVIVDTTKPILVGVPTFTTAECSSVPEPCTVTAHDNCDDALAAVTYEQTTGSTVTACSTELIRTWSVGDDSGNSVTQSQTITVIDQTPPVISGVPDDITIGCESESTYVQPTVTNADGCGNIASESSTPVETVTGNSKTTVTTYVATDDCGLSSTATFALTVVDESPPVISGVEADRTIEIIDENISDPSHYCSPSVKDNCDATVSITTTPDVVSASCDTCACTRSVSFEAEDASGNVTSSAQTLTYVDSTPPVVSGLGNESLTVECDDVPTYNVQCLDENKGTFAASKIESVVQGTCTQNYTVTTTYSCDDSCGNTSSSSVVVNVQDSEGPVFVPGQLTEFDLLCSRHAEVANLPNPLATDNCDENFSINNTPVDTSDVSATSTTCEGSITNTYVATDECGNSSTHVVTANLKDQSPPTINTALVSETIECSETEPTVTPDVSDDCSSVNTTSVPTDTTTCAGGSVKVTDYTYADACGNETTESYTLTIVDTTPPVISNTPASQTYTDCLTLPTLTSEVSTMTQADSYTDNCSETETKQSLTSSESDSTTTCTTVTTRQVSVQDDCGNTTTSEWKYTVNDETAPVVTNKPAHVTITSGDDFVEHLGWVCDLVGASDVQGADYNSCESACISDENCHGFNYMNGDCKVDTAQSACLTLSVSTQETNYYSRTMGGIARVPAVLDANANDSAISILDACDANPAPQYVETTAAGPNDCQFVLTRTWTPVDACSNESGTFSQTITVIDSTPPIVESFDSSDVTCSCEDTACYAQPPDITFTDCGVSTTVSATKINYVSQCEGAETFTWSYTHTDAANNSATYTRNIIIVDNVSPTLSGVPEDETLECGSTPTAPTVTGDDSCKLNGDYVVASSMETVSNNVSDLGKTSERQWIALTSGSAANLDNALTTCSSGSPGDEFSQNGYIYTYSPNNSAMCPNDESATAVTTNCCYAVQDQTQIVQKYTAVDDCGNSFSDTFTMTFVDTTDPTFSNTAGNSTRSCADNKALSDKLTGVTLSNCDDVCGDTNGIADVNSRPCEATDNDKCTEVLVVTEYCWDYSGNNITRDFEIAILDQTPPTISSIPDDVTVQCNPSFPAAGDVTGSDTCDDAPVDNFSDDTTNNGTPDDSVTLRTYTLTDSVGNVTSQVQTITVKDITPPVIDVQPNTDSLTVECDYTAWGGAGESVTYTDNCSATDDLVTNFTEVTTSQTCANNAVYLRTWTATDENGLSYSREQNVLVLDNTPPTFDTTPGDSTVEHNSYVQPGDLTATDNCSSASVSCTYTEDSNTCAELKTVTVSCTATDDCGLETTHSYVITKKDTSAPTLTFTVEDRTEECDGLADQASTAPTYTIVTLDGQASSDITVTTTSTTTGTDGVDGMDCFTKVWTYVASDCAGNTETYTRSLTVKDEEDPSLVFTSGGSVVSAPTSANYDCSTDVPVETHSVKVTDTCAGETTTATPGILDIDGPTLDTTDTDIWTRTTTYTATDSCGNQSSHSYTITVNDTTPPTLAVTIPTVLTSEHPTVPSAQTCTYADNCGETGACVATDNITQGACTNNFDKEFCYDSPTINGSAAEQICYTINVRDTTPPELHNLPSVVTPSSLVGTTLVYTTDDELNSIHSAGGAQPASVGDDRLLLHFSGGTWNNDVTVVDTRVWTDSLQTNVPAVTAKDMLQNENINVNYVEDSVVHHAMGGEYNVTRTWVAEDECLNSVTYVQTIFVRDLVPPPALGCIPADITIPCNVTDLEATMTEHANLYENTTAGCDWEEIDRVRTVASQNIETSSTCNGNLVRTYKYTVYDIVGNFIEQSQTITVYDNEGPVFDDAGITDITGDPNYGTPIDFCNYNGPKNLTAVDACLSTETVVTKSSDYTYPIDTPPHNKAYDAGGFMFDVTHTYNTADDCGNPSSFSYVESIRDLHYPVLTCTHNCDLNKTLECGADVAVAPVYTAEDGMYGTECSDVSIPYDVTITPSEVASTANPKPANSGCNDDVHKFIYTASVTDDFGNNSQTAHTISVTDTTPPVLYPSPLNDFDIQAGKVCANSELFTHKNGEVCYFQGVSLIECAQKCLNNEKVASCSSFPETQQDCTFGFQYDPLTSKCHFSSGCTEYLDNTGTTANFYTKRQASILATDFDCLASSASDLGITVHSMSCTENCSECLLNMSESWTTSTNSLTSGTYNTQLDLSWTSTDLCGFTDTTSVSISRAGDSTPPVFDTIPDDISLECQSTAQCGASHGPCFQDATKTMCDSATAVCVAADTTPGRDDSFDKTTTLSASDECWGQSYTITATESSSDLDNCTTQHEQTFVAIDDAGNETTHVRTITVTDTTPPTFVDAPANPTTTFTCTRGADPVINATDDCSTASVTSVDTTRDDCNVSNYEQLVEYTATDECGLTTVYVHTIKVEDTTPPQIGTDAAWTAQDSADNQCEPPAVFSPVPFTDTCYTGALVSDFEETTTSTTDAFSYTIERKWTVYDDADKTAICTNSVEKVQTLVIQDNTKPVCTLTDGSITIECDDVFPTTFDGTCSDACDTSIDNSSPVLADSTSTQSADPATAEYYNFSVEQTWTTTDVSGNIATSIQTIVVKDTTPPTASLNGGYQWDETYYASCSLNTTLDYVFGNFTASDNCDTDVLMTHVDTIISPVDSVLGAVGSCNGRLTEKVELCAYDESGNVNKHVVTISAEDHTPPTIEISQVPDILRDITRTAIHWVVDTENKKPVGGKMLTKEGVSINDCAVLGNDYATKLFYYEATSASEGTCVIPLEPEKHTCTCDTATGNTYKVVEDDDTWFSIGLSDVGKVDGLTVDMVNACSTSGNPDFQDIGLKFSFNSERASDPLGYGRCSRDWNDKTTPLASDCCVARPQYFIVIAADVGTVEGITNDRLARCEDASVPTFEEGGYTWLYNENGSLCKYDIRDLHEDVGNCCVDPYHPQGVSPSLMTDGLYSPGNQYHVLPDATDDCDADVTVTVAETTTSTDCNGSYTLERTFTATDDCNQSVTHVTTITVRDLAPPTFINTQYDETVDGGAMCYADFDANAYLAAKTVSAIDQTVGAVTVTHTPTHVPSTGDNACDNTWQTEAVFSAQDDCGNASSFSATFSFIDNTDPVVTISGLASITSECDETKSLTVATVNDNCMATTTVGRDQLGGTLTIDGVSLTSEQSTSLNDQNTYLEVMTSLNDNDFTVLNTYDFTDDCGNVGTFVQTITLQDTTPPTITIPDDKTLECAASITVATVAASDNCDDTFTEANYVGETTIGTSACTNKVVKEHKYSISDRSGNETTAVYTITVDDVNPPVLSDVPSDETVSCDTTYTAASANASDVCDGATSNIVPTEQSTFDGSCHSYTKTFTYTNADVCGNTVEQSFVLTVTDTGGLTVNVPNPENTPTGTINYEDIGNAWPGDVTGTDDCALDNTYGVNFVESISNKTCPHTFTVTRVWDIKDTCGNTDSYTQSFDVQDVTPPTITPTGTSPVLTWDEKVKDMLSLSEVVESLDFDLHDNSNDNIVTTLTDNGFTADSGACSGVHSATFTAADMCGNETTYDITVAIVDSTPPQLSEYPADAIFEVDEVPAACVVTTVDESCFTGGTVNYSESTVGDKILRTWTATDGSNLSTTHVQTITVRDTVPPAFTRLPADENIECDCYAKSMANPSVIAIDNDPNNQRPTVNFQEGTKNYVAGTNNYTQVNTWTASDAAGNTISHNQTITVTDTTPPSIVDSVNGTPFTTLQIDCAAALSEEGTIAPVMAAIDLCDDPAPQLFNSTTISGRTHDDCNTYTVTRLWEATDKAGNYHSFSQTVSIEDGNAPTCMSCSVQNCLYDNDNYKSFAVTDLFDIVDDCSSEPQVTVTACMANYNQNPIGNFDAECYLDGENLWVRGARDDAQSQDRVFTVYAQIQDSCANNDVVSTTVKVPSRADALTMHCLEPDTETPGGGSGGGGSEPPKE